MQDFGADVDSSVYAEKDATSERFRKTLLPPNHLNTQKSSDETTPS